MDGERIQLPDFLIAELYKNSLTQVENWVDKELPMEKKKEIVANVELLTPIKFLGENSKKVIILVKQEGQEFLSKPDLVFLTNILKACQLSINDIAIINIASQEVTFNLIKDQLDAVQVLLFDIEPSSIKLPFTIPDFQVQNYSGCTIVLAPALSKLNQATADGRVLKTKLWNSLKQVFNLS